MLSQVTPAGFPARHFQDGLIFKRCFAPRAVVQNQRRNEKRLNLKQKNLLSAETKGGGNRVGKGHYGVLRMKSKAGPMADSTCSEHRPQSPQKSRISAKNGLTSFGIYNSFLWPERGSCLDVIPQKHSMDTH